MSPLITLKVNLDLEQWQIGIHFIYIKKKRDKSFTVFFLNFQREVLKASGYHNTIGYRMKQKKLYEEFPAIDSSVLDEIFQANWFVNISPMFTYLMDIYMLICYFFVMLMNFLIIVCYMINNFSGFFCISNFQDI